MVAEQVVSEGYKAVELVVASGIGGAVVGVIMNFWVNKKLQAQQHKHDKQLESLKSILGKKSTVHKLQFEKEFQLYGELWKALFDLRSKVCITPTCDRKPKGKPIFEVYKKRYDAAFIAFNEANGLFNNHRPFYHDDVSKITKGLLSQCRGYIGEVGKMLSSEKDKSELFDKADKLLEKSTEAIDGIEKAIKLRIGILQKAEIVE